MRKSFLFLTMMVASSLASAESLKSSIHSISYGGENEPDLLKLNNGRVVFVSGRDKGMLQSKSLTGVNVEVEVDENNNLEGIVSMPEEPVPTETTNEVPASVNATVLESEDQVENIFRGMNRTYYNRTECTDRAQIWAYESWKKHGLVSKKVFMFFTNTYIRRYRYHWWFHVSPYTLVKSGEEVLERVLDRRYTTGPRTMKNWSDIFIRSRKACPVTTYRHYRQNKNGPEHCFHVKSEMYYRLPLHVRNLEDSGTVKTQFSSSEINFSYRAFRRRQVR